MGHHDMFYGECFTFLHHVLGAVHYNQFPFNTGLLYTPLCGMAVPTELNCLYVAVEKYRCFVRATILTSAHIMLSVSSIIAYSVTLPLTNVSTSWRAYSAKMLFQSKEWINGRISVKTIARDRMPKFPVDVSE